MRAMVPAAHAGCEVAGPSACDDLSREFRELAQGAEYIRSGPYEALSSQVDCADGNSRRLFVARPSRSPSLPQLRRRERAKVHSRQPTSTPPQPQPSPVKPTCGSGRAWQSRASTPSTHSPCSRASRASSAPSAWAERNGVPMSRGVVGVRPRRRTTAQPESPRVRGCPYQCMCTRPRPAMHEEEAEAYAGPRGLVRSLRCAQTLPIYRKAT